MLTKSITAAVLCTMARAISRYIWLWHKQVDQLVTRSTVQVLTKSVTAAVLNGAGDILCQLWIDGHRLSELDWKRLGKFSLLVSREEAAELQQLDVIVQHPRRTTKISACRCCPG